MDRQSRTFTSREILLLWISSSVLVLSLALLFFPDTLEDAYITFRYSRHLAVGHGFGAWNVFGERVEGYTSFLWMILVAWTDRLGIDPRVASKVVGISSQFLLVSLLILFPGLRNGHERESDVALGIPNASVLAGVLCALYLPLAWYATSGMETLFFALLVTAGFILLQRWAGRTFWLTVLVMLLTLTRPEGAVVAIACMGFAWLQLRTDQVQRRGLLVAGGGFLLTFGGLLAQRAVLFHDLLPNTYWAKVAGDMPLHVRLGFIYVVDWVKAHYPIVFFYLLTGLALVKSLARERSRELACGWWFAASLPLIFTAFTVRVGGDNYSAFPYWRHFLHFFPLIGLVACYSIVRVLPKWRSLQLLLVVAMVSGVDVGILNGTEGELRMAMRAGLETWPVPLLSPHNRYYVWLDGIVDDDTTIASSLGGELPYVVDAVHLDILGLNTHHIAHFGTYDPHWPLDSKTDMQWVLSQRPDVIEGYISARRIMEGEGAVAIMSTWRYAMNFGLVSSPIFQQEYLFVRNAPYDSLDRALFVNRDFWMRHPMRTELDCVPVSDTVLGSVGDVPE